VSYAIVQKKEKETAVLILKQTELKRISLCKEKRKKEKFFSIAEKRCHVAVVTCS
jgi:hypothetical protein